ncbi:serine threonine phosphatase 6 regulatory ankyrin repeat subunit b [Fusarium beomiforme]|uniref:Serine threonine phosphatase 6 regulatory ankyrin repeat subunit b n=1 Tax=Fusarium beomiforme TaxID=44412 RepID=A0A9P5A4X2_9HYPO|nr:serine threonine phosphatase 6 regulatory ankyrin repeat subunit b [Fusarium beomiforme]
MLLKRGAVVNQADKQGLTALHTASSSGDVDIIRVLLSHKPKLDLRAKRFGTALYCAVTKVSMDVVMALIEAEVPINELDVYGDTASHIAVRMARTSILRILVRHGADLSILNSTCQTPKDLANSIGTFDIIPILEILGGNDHAAKSAVSYDRWAEDGFSGLQGGARDESNDNTRDDTIGRDEVEDSDGESLMPRVTSLDRTLFGEGPEGQQENTVVIELSVDVIDRMGQVLNSSTKAQMMTDYILERCREDINKDCRPETQPKDLIRKLGRAIRLHNTEACKFIQPVGKLGYLEDQPESDKLYVEAVVILVEELWKPCWETGASREAFVASILAMAKSFQDEKWRQDAASLDGVLDTRGRSQFVEVDNALGQYPQCVEVGDSWKDHPERPLAYRFYFTFLGRYAAAARYRMTKRVVVNAQDDNALQPTNE